MPMYCYVKATPKASLFPQKMRKTISKTLGASFMFIGLIMLSFVFYPILQWQFTYRQEAPEKKLIKPTPLKESSNPAPGRVLAQSTQEELDLTKASNWFPGAESDSANISNINEFSLSIPKLKIDNGRVLVGGEDLSKSLINYKGTAIPGEYGNSVIFGHSVLPVFFNPKDYNTIFSTLPNLKVGDEIITNVDQIEYRYTVFELRTVDPSDISVLEQKYDDSYLSLVTCVPPGLNYKRLIVKARLNPHTNSISQTL